MNYTMGIDFSTTNTGITVLMDNEFMFNYLISKKGDFNNRVLLIWMELKQILLKYPEIVVGIESPSFYSKGKVIDIAAGYGYIYYSILNMGYTVYKLPPSEVKKFATGKGNASKDDMWDAYPKALKDELESSSYKKYDDLVDSYFIAKLAYKKHKENTNG